MKNQDFSHGKKHIECFSLCYELPYGRMEDNVKIKHLHTGRTTNVRNVNL